MDVMQRRVAWSTTWGVLALICGGAAVSIWIAASTPGTKIPVWPVWVLTPLTIAFLYLCIACLTSRWPISRKGDEALNVDFGSEQVDDRMILWIMNKGPAAEFYVQVIAIRDLLGQKKAPQNWTVLWREDNSTGSKRIPTGARQGLYFARYDADAVNDELNTGHGDSNHWWFPTVPEPVGVRYYNLRSRNDLELQYFTLTVRIINETSGKYLDWQVVVRIQNQELCCEITQIAGSELVEFHLGLGQAACLVPPVRQSAESCPSP